MTRRGDQRRAQAPPLTEQQKADRAVLSVMKDWPLQPGQMLLLGPQSVKILSTPGMFAGTLPDKLVLERKDWTT